MARMDSRTRDSEHMRTVGRIAVTLAMALVITSLVCLRLPPPSPHVADVTASVVLAGNTNIYSAIGTGYARSVWDLQAHSGRIYPGAGNAGTAANVRDQDVDQGVLKYFNPTTGLWVSTGFTPQEEQLQSLLEIAGDLYIPGSDSTISTTNENFTREVSGTLTERVGVLLNFAHCYDLELFGGQLFATGGASGASTVFKIASDGVGATSGAWANSSLSSPFRAYDIFVANGKLYFFHSMDIGLGEPNDALWVYAGTGTTVTSTGKKFADVTNNTLGTTYVDRNGATQTITDGKSYRATRFGSKTFYIIGHTVADHQILGLGLYSVTDSGTLNAGIDLTTFARHLHPDNGSITRPIPRDIWTDGSTIRVLWSYLDGSSNIVSSVVESSDGATWSELFRVILNGAPGGAGGQTPAFSYEYLSGVHYLGSGSDFWRTSDTAVPANVGEIYYYDANPPATIYGRSRPGTSRRNRSPQAA